MKTFGCQANVADSLVVETYLRGIGCTLVATAADADLIIVNSCAIREKAEHKMFSYVGALAQYKEKKPYLSIGVIGCVASYRREEILDRLSHVTFAFGGRDDLDDLKAYTTDLVETIISQKSLYYSANQFTPAKKRERDVVGLVKRRKLRPISSLKLLKIKPKAGQFKRSMINIMRGCNNFCTFCIVPFTTGRERSFPMTTLLEQIKREVDAGAKEITLIGQNVNSYKDPETGVRFPTLLDKVAQIDGDFWVRFVSPHPKDMTREVLEVVAAYDKLCTYIHLPLQSGSDRILRLMRRTYTAEKYLEQVDMIRKILPTASVSTDIIVGFPGEEEADYQQSRDMMEAVRYGIIYSFVYSVRKYTRAASFADSCSPSLKLERLQQLQARQREIGTEVNQKLVGKTLRILIEEKRPDGKLWGRTEGNIRVVVTGDKVVVNEFIPVLIESSQLSDIKGTVVQKRVEDAILGQKVGVSPLF